MAKKTGLVFTFEVGELSADTFGVLEFSGEEHLSRPFFFTIKLISRIENILPENVVDRNGVLKIKYNGKEQQLWHGIISKFKRGDSGHRGTAYSVEFVPALHRLSICDNSRFFLEKDPKEIIQKLVTEKGIAANLKALPNELKKREYCVQYREDSLSFIDRLAAEEGFFYYFEHTEKNDEVTFCDNTHKTPSFTEEIEYNAKPGGMGLKPYIRSFKQKTTLAPLSVELRDYSFLVPQTKLFEKAGDRDPKPPYEHFDYPGRFKESSLGKSYTDVRFKHLRKDSYIATGISNCPSIVAGSRFTLKEHPVSDFNDKWLITSVIHSGTQPQESEDAGASGASTYQNEFAVIPNTQQWKPTPNPKPCVDGPQIAKVVGPEGEEINCDKYGRVKVEFPWYLEDRNEQMQSCWVRFSDGWAGGHYGSIAIPRIGHEVIVSFLEGDPDQPIITGRTYHETNKTPYPLADKNTPTNSKTRTIFRTQSHKSTGHNEVRFEDEDDREEIYMHAQHDTRMLVENTYTDNIEHNCHSLTNRDEIAMVRKNSHTVIDGEQHVAITKMSSLFVSDSQHIRNSSGHFLEAGEQIHLEAGAKAVIEAINEITVKAGGSFIKINPYGVTISGTAINLNAGGVAGNGCGFSGVQPELPPIVQRALTFDTIATPEGTPLSHAKLEKQSLPVFQVEEKEELIASQKKTDRKLFIEVTGHDHAEDQYLQFYSHKEKNRLNALEEKKETEKLESSMLHSWDWNDQEENIDVRLTIKGSEGDIILPLYDDIFARSRRLREQAHIIQATVPTTMLPTYDKNIDEKKRIAPLRDGYLYVIYKGELWREIHVTAPNGEPEFSDVNLEAYKDEDRKFIKGYRKPTGNPLKEIWLPYKRDTRRPSVEIAYSDVQLSAARLNFYVKEKEFSARANVAQYRMAESMDKMRSRNAAVEMNLAEPYKYNRDLSGTYIDGVRSKIESDIDVFKKGGKAVEELVEKDSPHQLEYGLKASCILKMNGKEDHIDWSSSSVTDYLTDAKQRKIRSTHVLDYTFKLRQRYKIIFHAIAYLSTVIVETQHSKYIESASALNNIVTPKNFGKRENESHKYLEDVDTTSGSTFSTTLRSTEREQVHSDFKKLKSKLNRTFTSDNDLLCLKDYSSLDDANAASTHVLCFNVLRALSFNTSKIDIYCQTERRGTSAIYYFRSQSKGRYKKIHDLLFIKKEEIKLIEKKEKLPTADNDGSGLPTLKNIFRWKDGNLLIQPSKVLTEEAKGLIDNQDEEDILHALDHVFYDVYQMVTETNGCMNKKIRDDALTQLSNLTKVISEAKFASLEYRTVTLEYHPPTVNLEYHQQHQSTVTSDTRRRMTQTVSNALDQPNLVADTKNAVLGLTSGPGAQLIQENWNKMAQTKGIQYIKKTGGKFKLIRLGLQNPQLTSIKTKMFQLPKDIAYTAETFCEHHKIPMLKQITKKGMPAFVVFIELENIFNSHRALSANKNYYNSAVLISAIGDLGACCIELGGLQKNEVALKKIIPKKLHGLAPLKNVKNVKIKPGTLFIRAAGALTSAILIYDACNLCISEDYDAAFLTFLQAGVSAALIFVTGPLGIGLFALSVALSVAIAKVKDTPIENWIEHGPFGESPFSGKYKDNIDPELALFSLLNTVLDHQETIIPLSKLEGLTEEEKTTCEKKKYTHCLVISYGAPFLLASQNIKYVVRIRQGNRITMPKCGESYFISRKDESITTKPTSNGVIVFFRSPSKATYKLGTRYTPCINIRSQINIKGTTFPKLYNEKKALPIPNFNDDDLGWYHKRLLIQEG